MRPRVWWSDGRLARPAAWWPREDARLSTTNQSPQTRVRICARSCHAQQRDLSRNHVVRHNVRGYPRRNRLRRDGAPSARGRKVRSDRRRHAGETAAGYLVHVAADAVSSRTELNWRIGLDRMRAAGAILSSAEMMIYELLRSSGAPAFREMLPYLKG